MWKWDWIIRSRKMKKQGAEISCVILWLPLPCCPCSCQCQIQKSPSTVLEEPSQGLTRSIAVKAAARGQRGQRQWPGWRAGAQPHAEEPFWAASCRRCSLLITIIRTWPVKPLLLLQKLLRSGQPPCFVQPTFTEYCQPSKCHQKTTTDHFSNVHDGLTDRQWFADDRCRTTSRRHAAAFHLNCNSSQREVFTLGARKKPSIFSSTSPYICILQWIRPNAYYLSAALNHSNFYHTLGTHPWKANGNAMGRGISFLIQ